MNTFIVELFDDEFPLVTFYSVRWDTETISETEKFARRFAKHKLYADDYNQIAYLLQLMGEEEGATDEFFTRHEDEASALPPSRLKSISIPLHDNQLRLYCTKITDSIVVLFNGGIKSARTAQESEDLQAKFRDAKGFARRIWKEINDGMIEIDRFRHRLFTFNQSEEIIVN